MYRVQEFNDISKLIAALNDDMNNTTSATLNRFPIRFILVPTFNELRLLVNHFIKNKTPLVKIDALLPHADGWPSVDLIINTVKQINQTTALIPLSEVLRFSKKDEFNNVLNSLAQQMSMASYRIFIPIVGLSQRFKSQFYNSFSRKANWPDVYHLCGSTDEHIVVKHLPIHMFPQNKDLIVNKTIVSSSSDWFKLWSKPITNTVYCTSALLFHKSIEFQPDEYIDKRDIVSYSDVLREIYDIELAMVFKDEDSEFAENMIKYINNKGLCSITEEALYSIILNVHDVSELDDEKIVSLLVSNDSENGKLKTWLVSKLVTDDYIIVGQYLKSVLSKSTGGFHLLDFLNELWFSIFTWDIPRTPDLYDRRKIIDFIYRHFATITLPDEEKLQKKLEAILVTQMPFQTKLLCFTAVTNAEKEVLVSVYSKTTTHDEPIFWDTIQPIYPEFYSYAKWDVAIHKEDWITNYFKEYVQSKARNEKSGVLSEILSDVSKDHESFWTWYHELFSRRPDISESQIVWVDGLGIEWLPVLLKALFVVAQSSGYSIDEVVISSCKLPSTTQYNRYDSAVKINLLDQYIHNQCPYKHPNDLVREIDLVKSIATKIFSIGKDDEFWIVSDHGFTFLSQKKYGIEKKYNIQNAEHDGRYFFSNSAYAEDHELLSVTDSNGSNIVMSLTHNSLFNVPYREVHGGCTPEEVMIPFIKIKKQVPVGQFVVKLLSAEINVKKPIVSFEICPSPNIVSLKLELTSKCVSIPMYYDGGLWHANISSHFKPGDYMIKLEVDTVIHEYSVKLIGGMKERDLI